MTLAEMTRADFTSDGWSSPTGLVDPSTEITIFVADGGSGDAPPPTTTQANSGPGLSTATTSLVRGDLCDLRALRESTPSRVKWRKGGYSPRVKGRTPGVG